MMYNPFDILVPARRALQLWWLNFLETHYLVSADVEQARAREAQHNAAYYHKRAALARSRKIDIR